ncbi:hypothetical protein BDW74DRAFT_177166 [Aspergillus multicolor]|uniref:uncharacterized protein n=1 Tax=Aspergillus multicolor TaxID=41759 RepID=UPI003CCDE0CB
MPSPNTDSVEEVQSQPASGATTPGPSTNAEDGTKTSAGRGVDASAELDSGVDRNKVVEESGGTYTEPEPPSPPDVASRRRWKRSRPLTRPVGSKVRPRKLRRNLALVENDEPKTHGTIYSKLYLLYRKAVALLETVERVSTDRRGFPKANLYTVSYVDNPAFIKREIYVPDETIASIAGVSERFSQSENVWFMGALHGDCRVHVMPSSESLGVDRKVVLIGLWAPVKRIIKHMMMIKKRQEQGDPLLDIQKPPVPIFPSRLALAQREQTEGSRDFTIVRGVWTLNPRPQVHIDALIDGPHEISSVRQFTEHVEQLTKAKPTSGHSTRHSVRVAEAFRDLFLHRNTQHLVSTAAFNVAISYLLQHNLRDTVRALFNRAGHVATVESFNILLKHVAKFQDIESFCSVLAVMAKVRVASNIRTWLALLNALVFQAQRADLVKLLEQKGYLEDPYVLRSVLQSMVQGLFKEHLRLGRSSSDFFHQVVLVSGSNWFPPSLTRQMFAVTAKLKNVDAMQELLKLCKENQVQLGSAVAYEIIKLFPRDTYSAVSYAIQCLDFHNAELDKPTYERLFANAFQNKHYNVCRVLWRYACMNESTTEPMRDAMIFLLMQNIASNPKSEQEKLWWTSAGKVIAGLCLHLQEYPLKQELLKNLPFQFHEYPLSAFTNPVMVEGKEREDQNQAARAIIQHDYEVGPWFRPTYSIAHMLEAALQLDMEFGSAPRPTKWLIQNAIHIPFELDLSKR